MNIITRECDDCSSLQQILEDIDCTILDLITHKYNQLIYGVDIYCKEALYDALIVYKRILTARLYNCVYPCSPYNTNEILSKARLLVYKTNCSRCPECEEIIIPSTTTTFPPDEGRCVTYLLNFVGDATYPYSYIDCEGSIQTGSLNSGEFLNICAIQYSIVISPNVTIIQTANDCSLTSCYSYLLTNIRESGAASYNYTTCDGSPDIAELLIVGAQQTVCSQNILTSTTDVSVALVGGCNT